MTTDDQPSLTIVFVYGTLKRGYCRDFALKGQCFLGTARTIPRYRMYDLGSYPGLIAKTDGISIEGELWEVDSDCLALLDEIEEVADNCYQRLPIRLEPPHHTIKADAYFYLGDVRGLPDCGSVY